MSVHNGQVIVLNNVTPRQLRELKLFIEKQFTDLPAPDFDLKDEDMDEDNARLECLWAGLFNLCCDLDIEGYEI